MDFSEFNETLLELSFMADFIAIEVRDGITIYCFMEFTDSTGRWLTPVDFYEVKRG